MRCAGGSSVVAAAVVVVLGSSLSACTPTPAPAPTTPATSTSSTSSPTSSASPTSSTTSGTPTSTQALTPLQKEAIAAVEAFYDEFNKASETRTSTAFRKRFSPECAACLLLATSIDDLKANDQIVVGSNTKVFDLEVSEGTNSGIGVQGGLFSAAVNVKNAQGEVVGTFPEETKKPVVWLLRRVGSNLVVFDVRADR